jgi:glutamate dehydrogenase
MPLSQDTYRTELLDRATECARWRLGDAAAAAIEPFIRQYFARVPLVDIRDSTPDAVFGSAYAHWRLAETRAPATQSVRVYNPVLAEHGWHSDHTVVEVVTDDMPFLVDSVTTELNSRELTVHLVVHPIVRVRRDEAGRLQGLGGPDSSSTGDVIESFMHIETTRLPDPSLAEIETGVRAVLADVRAAVDDWANMRERVDVAVADLAVAEAATGEEEIAEARALLDWIRENNFTFLGYRAYDFPRVDGERMARVVPNSGLGLLRNAAVLVFDDLRDAAPISPAVASFLGRSEVLAVTKSHRRSTVHRSVLLDAIVVKRLASDGHALGEHLFVGLFSAAAYNRSARSIPLLRNRLARVLASAGFEPRSHDGRALANIVETFPRDELFQVTDDELLDVAVKILQLQHRQRVALFVRRDHFDRYVSCLVYVPRDRYTTQLRIAVQSIVERAFAGRIAAQYLQVGDAPLARVHLVVRTTPGEIPRYDVDEIEAEIVAATRSWSDRLLQALHAAHGEEQAERLHARYSAAFPAGYCERFSAEQGIGDIAAIERAIESGRLEMTLYRPFAATGPQFRCKIYQTDQPIILSQVLPILEHLGLRVIEEVPHAVRVRVDGPRTVMIHDFGLETQSGASVSLSHLSERFSQAFLAVWEGVVESDRLNALVLSADLTVDQVRVLRAYAKYLRQAGIPFTQAYIERVLTSHPNITYAIVRLFLTLFDPDAEDDPETRAAPLRATIAAAFDQVESAEDDRILRRFLNLVEATLRTNFFQTDADGTPKSALAIKLDSRSIEDLPLPRPMVEIFVYSPLTEGIHLRGGKVARGGIRWSDRQEDFRTEILGLMKAQTVKNAVIVPVGAKGGFVVKRPVDSSDREAWLAQGIACYRSFIGSLLDITDNLKAGRVVPPSRVVRRDGDDPYLVVAADKGTATFSDIANGIAVSRDFWLGDAFASGGSQGYDHKAMGITARGAWESVKRHFREMGRNTQRETFTVVGVGDMSGDVFGNGMLLSPHIKLLAAFDHRHIFVDPDPDPEASFAERRRLFDLPRSSWRDYDAAKLSTGGAIFDRRAKMLVLTPDIRACFGIKSDRLTPSELIGELLRAPVDLLWFGGIGTYVKSANESHADAGDRANDALRVDARDLRCKVIGEGANLGITQFGRIEFARIGGRINTDFIDNSAGVDCSDHEVNIKILLNAVVADGDLTIKQRNQLLAEMTDEVAELVLRDNYLQTQAMSLIEEEGFAGLDAYTRLMRFLERKGRLNRAVEYLPDEDALAERVSLRQGLSRPEIAVLFSHCKIWLSDEVIDSDLPDDRHLASDVVRYFPTLIRERLASVIPQHRLKRELVATSLTNSLINRMGGTFVCDIAEKTGMSAVDIARAYIIARDVFAVRDLWNEIESLDGAVSASAQIMLHREVQWVIERGTMWFLRNGGTPLDITANVAAFEETVQALAAQMDDVLPEKVANAVIVRAGRWHSEGVPESTARRVARLLTLPSTCDIVRISTAFGIQPEAVARLHFEVGERLGLRWLREQAEHLSMAGYWQRLAVTAVIEELYAHQRDVTQSVLAAAGTAEAAAFDAWCADRPAAVQRSQALLAELESVATIELPMLAVASRQLRSLAEA